MFRRIHIQILHEVLQRLAERSSDLLGNDLEVGSLSPEPKRTKSKLRYEYLISSIALNDTFQAVSNLDLRALMSINILAIVANGSVYMLAWLFA